MLEEDVLRKAVAIYNEYRSPMATAELLGRSDESFTVRFSGPFCRTCCAYDYFEDLLWELDAFGLDPREFRVRDFIDEGPETYAVTFEPTSTPGIQG